MSSLTDERANEDRADRHASAAEVPRTPWRGPMIELQNLTRVFGSTRAVDGVESYLLTVQGKYSSEVFDTTIGDTVLGR
ncbi:MAG: hypothetical protein AAGJ83_06980, partial [Planctomycetota bacterium]